MKNSVKNQDKIKDYLKKMGNLLSQQREIISQKNHDDFAILLNEFCDLKFTAEDLVNMENGISLNEQKNSISIEKWLCIWLYFQNIENILEGYDISEMIYLAKMEND